MEMSAQLLSVIKPLKIIGNIFGFIPFCLEKTHKIYFNFRILNYIYVNLLISAMIYTIYFNLTVLTSWFENSSMMSSTLHKVMQIVPMSISIIHCSGIIIHLNAFVDVYEQFCDIDKKVSHLKILK